MHPNATHGQSKTLYYKLWAGMIQRCYDKKHQAYKWYGARGVRVCRRWRKFENFAADMGPRPPGKSLEREINSKGYNKGNCIWATPKQQAANRRSTRLYTYGSVTMCLKDWARTYRIKYHTLYTRVVRLGWAFSEALDGHRSEGCSNK